MARIHPRNCIKGLKLYCEQSNVHGLKYIVIKNHHWSERLLWLILCTLSWCACAIMISNIIEKFTNKPVAITVDTSYLDWRSPFPTVAICSSFNQAAKEYAAEMIKKFSDGKLNARTLSEQLFLPSRMGYLQRLEKLNIPAEDYVLMYGKAKPNCLETFEFCKWNDKLFDCCYEFVTLHTAVGFCQMLNSIHAKSDASKIDFSVNRTRKYARLAFDFTDKFRKANADIQIFILNNVEIPTMSTSNDKIIRNVDNVVGIDFNMIDVVNEAGVRSVSAKKRECRFPEENKDSLVYDLYSFDACTTDAELMRMLERCSCVSYAFPRKSAGVIPVCNMTGMRCINEFRQESLAGTKSNSNEDISYCAPDCEGAYIDWYKSELKLDENSTVSSGLRMRLLSTPSMRYQRYVVCSLLDVVVACGSSVGLFTGASLLSMVELVYWILFRRNRAA